jgi:lysine-specific permease
MEFWLSFGKIISVAIFIVIGLYTVMYDNIGFQNWSIEGAPFVGGFKGTFSVFIAAYFSFGGTELIGVTAGGLITLTILEASNPRETIPKAIKATFWRILFFYTTSVFVMGLLIPYNRPELPANSLSKLSPFTVALELAHVPYASDIINVVIIVALLSAANTVLYISSRMLMSLAQNGSVLANFSETTQSGVPLNALIPSFLFAFISLIASMFTDVSEVFDWLMCLVGFNGCIIWAMICLIHLRFRQALKAQNYDLKQLPYKTRYYPYGNIIAILGSVVVIFGTVVIMAIDIESNPPIKWLKTFGGVWTYLFY